MSEAGVATPNFSREQAVADIRRSTEDNIWLNAHRDALRAEFANMFVAVYDRKVVGVAEAVEDMKAAIRAKGIDPEKCVTEVLLTEDYIWVL
ncbi:MAG: hypothetical protein L3K09_01980 [Thermoplasmata archaeon]|nr:hypothetical protein [Thermoplasmata archaeon]